MIVSAPVLYSMRSVEALGISRHVVRRLVNAGCVSPARGPRNEYRFSFQDVVLLRTAHRLQQAHVPPRRLMRSLSELRARLPADIPISGLRITAIGDRVAVHQGGAPWSPENGQLLLDFDVSMPDGDVMFIDRPAAAPGPPSSAQDWFDEGVALEASDRDAAMAAYRRALELDPGHADAYVNLGALLCESGHGEEALALYEQAAELAPDDPNVHFNGAMALEDLGMLRDAVSSYERCLVLAPYLVDAHYNLARLYGELGNAQALVRHYNAYRRAQRAEEARPSGPPPHAD